MGKIIPARLIVASLLALQPDQLINFRELDDGGAITITPTGQKYKFTPEHLAAKEQTLVRAGLAPALETETPPGDADPAPNPPVNTSVGAGPRPALGSKPTQDPAPNILDKIMETKDRPPADNPVTTPKPKRKSTH